MESEKLYYEGKIEESFKLNFEAYQIDSKENEENIPNYYILNSLAVCYYHLGNYDKAIEHYHKVIEIEPRYYQAYIDISTVYRNLGKYEYAVKFIEQVIENVNSGDIYEQAIESKGRILMCMQHYKEANQLLRKLEKKEDAEFLEALALSYMYMKDYDKAKECFLHAFELCKDMTLKECLDVRYELADFCSEIYGEDTVFENIEARDMVLGLPRDKIQIIKAVFISMKDSFSIGKKYCKQYERKKSERSQRYSFNYVLCLKGWSSSTPELSLGGSSKNLKKGGGFYIRYNSMGIVIDPGINFVENLHENNLYIQDIDMVIVTHNHIDHNNDLKKILDMNYQIGNEIVYVVDKQTYSDYIRDFETVERKSGMNVIKIFPDAKEKKKNISIKDKGELAIHILPTEHNCEGSFGFKLLLGNKVLGYTSDTRYTKEIGEFFENSDVIIANISETNREDLMLMGSKQNHLGIHGVSKLLKDLKGKKGLCLLTEFFGGFGDIRLEMASIVKEYVKNDKMDIVPVDIGMTYFLDNEKFLCNNCESMIDKDKRTVARIGKENGRLICLCNNCLYRG